MFKHAILAVSLMLLLGCTTSSSTSSSQTANPASLNCIDQGFTVEIRNTPSGQVGYCIFSDSTECEEWAFLRSECTIETASTCKDLCGNGLCEEVVCEAFGCPCAETAVSCPNDC